MPGFLLDNNHVSEMCRRTPRIQAKLAAIGKAHLRTCSIVLGEAEAGNSMTGSSPSNSATWNAAIFNDLIRDALDVTSKTRIYYAKIMGEIWRAYPPPSANVSTARHLVDHGIDTNDVWIAAVAMEHGLTLLTHDNMDCIRAVCADIKSRVVPDSGLAGFVLEFDDWLI